MRVVDKLYWSRVVLGGISGLISFAVQRGLNIGEIVQLAGIIIAVSIYALSVLVIRALVKSGRIRVPGRGVWIEGIGSFFLSWFFVWSLALNI